MEDDLREALGLSDQTTDELAAGAGGAKQPQVAGGGLWPRSAAPILLACLMLGAIIGGSLRPLAQDRFLADAVVGVESAGNGNAATSTWRTFQSIVELPQVARAAVRGGNLDISPVNVPDRVTALGDPQSKVLRVRARAESHAQATVLADAVTRQAIAFARRAARASLVQSDSQTAFDFETGIAAFGASTPFTTPATRLARVKGGRPPGKYALGFRCASSRPGCGPGADISAPFARRTRYVARAFVRSVTGVAGVRLILGAGGKDVAVGQATAVRSERYTPLRVEWTPARPAAAVTVALQTTRGRRVDLRADDLEVIDPKRAEINPAVEAQSDRLSEKLRAQHAAEGDAYVQVGMATPNGSVHSSTTGWAALGGLVGLMVALAGLVVADQARRRQE